MRKGSLQRYLSVLLLTVIVAALAASCSTGGTGNAGFTFEKAKLEKGSLSAKIVANGHVLPSRTVELTWKISGQVGDLLVKAGETVTEDQKVAELLESTVPTSIMSARVELTQAQQALEDLQNSRTTAEQARLALAQAQEELTKAEQKHAGYIQQTRPVADFYIDAARAELLMAESEQEKAQNAYDHVAGLPDDAPEKAIALKALATAKQAAQRALGNLNWYLGSPNDLDVEMATAELELAKARVEDAQRQYDRLKNGVPANELEAAKARVQIAQSTLDQMFVTAPFAGVVTNIHAEENDLVQPGQPLLVIEDQSHFYIDAEISEIDVNRIRLDQPVEITFDAVWGQTYTGKVIEIGTSGMQAQGLVNFPVRIELLDRDDKIRTGMTAVVSIQVEQVDDVLLVPNGAVRVLDGERVVYVDKGGPLPVSVPLVLGVSSDTMSEVVSGELKEGDAVILNPDMLMMQQTGGMP